MTDPKQFIFIEKHRPDSVEDCILPDHIKNKFLNMEKTGDIQNLLLTGPSGVGKTTVALALCRSIGASVMFINASDENGIDVLRTKVRDFASTLGLEGRRRVVIFDEADKLTVAAQDALRGFIEEFSTTCRFVFTANHKNKITKALQSRTVGIDFIFAADDRKALCTQFFKSTLKILDAEEITYDKKAVAELINRYYPDFRRVLNELQAYSTTGHVDIGILAERSLDTIDGLVTAIREKNFRNARTWISEHSDIQGVDIMRYLFEKLLPVTTDVPALVDSLNEYQKHLPWIADIELHTTALSLEIMGRCSFKDA